MTYRSQINKVMKSYNMSLIREKKHMIWRHNRYNFQVVCPSTTKCIRSVKNTEKRVIRMLRNINV